VAEDTVAVLPACAECGGANKDTEESRPPGYVYATGTVTAQFPSLDVEKEFLQAWGQTAEQSRTITAADKFAVLSQGQNLYLARQMCWIFQSGNIDLFVLQPRTHLELADLVGCLAPTPGEVSYALVVGTVGGVAPPWMCNGVALPLVSCEQVFNFTSKAFVNSVVAEIRKKETLINTIKEHLKPLSAPPTLDEFLTKAADNAFEVMTVLSDNTGNTDEHRAINYLTFKSMRLYEKEVELELAGYRLNSVTARPDPLSRTRRIQDVILLYAKTDTHEVQRFFTRIDVTGLFPFMINELAHFFDRP
jgi:hypothetical protein